jgi:DNA polymerase III epsilon subunit-like protein
VYLFFDTETTGIPRRHDAPAADVRNWPRLVQIAWLLIDAQGQELKSEASLIRPEGFEIPQEATRVHGISTETARRLGIQIGSALSAFALDLSQAECVVAHNVQFDTRVVGAEFFRAGHKNDPIQSKTLCCTMRSSTDFCRIPGGPRGYKWPTLDQLHRKLFGVGVESAHDASTDVRSCAKCFFELKRRGIIGA